MIFNINTKPVSSGVPEFTYTGNYEIVDDNNNKLTDMKEKNWRIRFLSSGDLIFNKLKGAKKGIDTFIVGGGGNGGVSGGNTGGGGGGGGYTLTQKNILIQSGVKYVIKIGAGLENSQAFGFSVNPGDSGTSNGYGGAGGADGGDGGTSNKSGTNGETGKLEFNIGPLRYGGGGGGGAGYQSKYYATAPGLGGQGGGGKGGYPDTSGMVNGENGKQNTGGGGGGSYIYGSAGSGGSGIVIIRNSRT